MFENLRKSYYANQSAFWSYQRLAESQNNPCHMEDFARACILAGRMEQTARVIMREYGDHTFYNDVSDIIRWCEETAECIKP